MTSKTESLRDIDFLAEALLLLRDGMFISVAPPFTLFDTLLEKLRWPASQRRRHLSRSTLETWNDLGFELTPEVHNGLGYQATLVAECSGCAVRDDGPWPFKTLDDIYEGLVMCSGLHVTQSIAKHVIAGASRLIQEYRPAIFLALSKAERHWPGDILALLKPLGYSFFANREPLGSESDTLRRFDDCTHIVALPSNLAALSGWSTTDVDPHRKPLRGRIAGWQGTQRAVRSEIANWTCRIAASDLLVSGMHPIEDDHQPTARWTGPYKNASVALFFPAAGTYRIAAEVREYAFDDTLGLGQLRIGNRTLGSTIWSDFSHHRIEGVYEIDQSCVDDGSIVTIITAGVGRRSLGGRWCTVGVALSAVSLTRISED